MTPTRRWLTVRRTSWTTPPPGSDELQVVARTIVDHERRVTAAVERRFRGEATFVLDVP
jgi:hypothetical protein